MKKVHLQLSEAERSHREGLVDKSTISVKVHRRVTALLALASCHPAAEKTRLVQDNLNTHDASSLRETFAHPRGLRTGPAF